MGGKTAGGRRRLPHLGSKAPKTYSLRLVFGARPSQPNATSSSPIPIRHELSSIWRRRIHPKHAATTSRMSLKAKSQRNRWPTSAKKPACPSTIIRRRVPLASVVHKAANNKKEPRLIPNRGSSIFEPLTSLAAHLLRCSDSASVTRRQEQPPRQQLQERQPRPFRP